ncbi:MAG: type II secretion system protein GspN [Bacteriovoracaceae bacterium]|nr:type II secretion system protein GspN [Bacteriovoracaceae bacterium]
MKEKINYNELSEDVYINSKLNFFKLMLLIIFSCTLGFTYNFPMKHTVNNLIIGQLKQLRSCPIRYDKLDMSFFLPKVTVINPVISGKCFNNPQVSLNLEDIVISPQIPNIYPAGAKFHLNIKKGESVANIYPSLSFSDQTFMIQDTKVDIDSFKEQLTGADFVHGLFDVQAKVITTKKAIKDAQVLLKSKNLRVGPKNISGFDLPELMMGNLLLKATYKRSAVKVESLIVGNENSPIHAKFDGTIKVNSFNPSFSKLNLLGEIKFSKKFMEEFSILNLFLGPYKAENGYYAVKVGGTIARPAPSPR